MIGSLIKKHQGLMEEEARKRNAMIIALCILGQTSMAEIGRQFGISRGRVWQIYRRHLALESQKGGKVHADFQRVEG